MNGIITMSA